MPSSCYSAHLFDLSSFSRLQSWFVVDFETIFSEISEKYFCRAEPLNQTSGTSFSGENQFSRLNRRSAVAFPKTRIVLDCLRSNSCVQKKESLLCFKIYCVCFAEARPFAPARRKWIWLFNKRSHRAINRRAAWFSREALKLTLIGPGKREWLSSITPRVLCLCVVSPWLHTVYSNLPLWWEGNQRMEQNTAQHGAICGQNGQAFKRNGFLLGRLLLPASGKVHRVEKRHHYHSTFPSSLSLTWLTGWGDSLWNRFLVLVWTNFQAKTNLRKFNFQENSPKQKRASFVKECALFPDLSQNSQLDAGSA